MIKKLITLLISILGVLFVQHSYADNTQITCLAKAMYFEARGGKPNEQINIGNVVLNRTQHKAFPSTACKVIADRKHAIQFPWFYNRLVIKDKESYKAIEQRARELYNSYVSGNRYDTTNGAVFFHAKTINPRWGYRVVSVNDTLHKYYKTKSI